MPIPRLKKRRDFVQVSRARNVSRSRTFVLQARCLENQEMTGRVAVGFTASRRVGNAVKRNRAKRRLRAIVDQRLMVHVAPVLDKNPGVSCQFVCVAVSTTANVESRYLVQDFDRSISQCIRQMHLDRRKKHYKEEGQ